MHGFNVIFRLFVIVFFLSLLSACESKYNKGYADGYESGYSVGKREGYEEGKEDGYTSGYASGTVSYVKKHGLPSLGLSIVILMFFAAIYYLYKYFRNPTKRIIDKSTDMVEEKRQKIIVKKELERKKLSVDEQARIKARTLANKVFEKTLEAISDEKSRVEVDKLRQEAEEKIFKIQLEEIDKIAREYNESLENLSTSKNLSSKEKSELYSGIREILAER